MNTKSYTFDDGTRLNLEAWIAENEGSFSVAEARRLREMQPGDRYVVAASEFGSGPVVVLCVAGGPDLAALKAASDEAEAACEASKARLDALRRAIDALEAVQVARQDPALSISDRLQIPDLGVTSTASLTRTWEALIVETSELVSVAIAAMMAHGSAQLAADDDA